MKSYTKMAILFVSSSYFRRILIITRLLDIMKPKKRKFDFGAYVVSNVALNLYQCFNFSLCKVVFLNTAFKCIEVLNRHFYNSVIIHSNVSSKCYLIWDTRLTVSYEINIYNNIKNAMLHKYYCVKLIYFV